jgi:PAS domain S-box-containing protein
MIYQNRITVLIEQATEELDEKEQIADDLSYSINLAISEMRAYFAYGGKETYYENVQEQKEIVRNKIASLQEVGTTEEDLQFLQDTKDFYAYYFHDIMPTSKTYYDRGEFEEVTKIAVQDNASQTIRNYQHLLNSYTDALHDQLSSLQDELTKKIFYSQMIFFSSLMIILGGMVISIRIALRKIGGPLLKLTKAAGEIAIGRTVEFQDTTNREDELGLLSKAFEKMSRSIQEKEQNLSAQNGELILQQEILKGKQRELEDALNTTQSRELDLKKRNDLINGIANSLDKKEVLSSIVETMCGIIGADKGIIVMLNRESEHSSFGVSQQGIQQFLNHLDSDSMIKLKETRKPVFVKRESTTAERGFHTDLSYAYDLFLPVFAPSGNIEALMLFSRFHQPYQEEELAEYESLCKQIAISLDKINLFEQSEEERLLTQDILDTIKGGIQLVDVSGKVIQVNQKLCDMSGKHSSSLIHQTYKQWVNEFAELVENGVELKCFFNNILFDSKPDYLEFIYYQQFPTQRVVQVYCEPLTRSGEKFGTVIVHRDITKEHEVDMMKSEFVSTVSHELRTPLASVLGFTELMLNKELKPERQKKYLTTIYQEAQRLTALINDFLDVQRMEAGKQTYNKKYDDVLPLLKTIIETYELNHPTHQFLLNIETNSTIVLGDKDKIAQVFTNLMSNAVKYSPDGGNITITIYEEGVYLNVAFADEGLGIPEDAMDKLFDKFFRIDNTDRRKIGGTGLGLSIVKKIVEDHQGEIYVKSVLKEGSTFTVRFPLVMRKTENSNQESLHQNFNDKVNVIIVEDDHNLATLLKTELEESRFHVKVLNDGETALNTIKTEQPDAIVLDIMLGDNGMNGWEIIKEMKKEDHLKAIPVFISSALDEKEKGMALGANEYLIKPYQPSTLSKLILQTLLKKDWSGQILIPSEET